MKIGEPTVAPALPGDPVPTITVLSPESSSAATRERVAEVFAAVESETEVAKSRAEFEAADKTYADLTGIIGPLNIRGKQLFDELAALHLRIGDDFLAQFAADGKATVADTDLDCLARNHAESRAVSQVLVRVGMHLLPAALIAKLSTESRLIFARVREFERIANERFERTAELLRGAAEAEGGVTVNVAGTFSGQLVAYAADLRSKGLELARRADEESRKYSRTVSELALQG